MESSRKLHFFPVFQTGFQTSSKWRYHAGSEWTLTHKVHPHFIFVTPQLLFEKYRAHSMIGSIKIPGLSSKNKSTHSPHLSSSWGRVTFSFSFLPFPSFSFPFLAHWGWLHREALVCQSQKKTYKYIHSYMDQTHTVKKRCGSQGPVRKEDGKTQKTGFDLCIMPDKVHALRRITDYGTLHELTVFSRKLPCLSWFEHPHVLFGILALQIPELILGVVVTWSLLEIVPTWCRFLWASLPLLVYRHPCARTDSRVRDNTKKKDNEKNWHKDGSCRP